MMHRIDSETVWVGNLELDARQCARLKHNIMHESPYRHRNMHIALQRKTKWFYLSFENVALMF